MVLRMFRAVQSLARVSSHGLAALARQPVAAPRLLAQQMLARRCFSDDNKPLVFDITSVEEFNEHVMQSPTPVIVDFHADWCGPCQMLGPRLEEKVNARGGDVVMAKINVDFAGELATDYNISAVPTVLAFNNGEVVDSFQGVVDDHQLDQFFDNAITPQ